MRWLGSEFGVPFRLDYVYAITRRSYFPSQVPPFSSILCCEGARFKLVFPRELKHFLRSSCRTSVKFVFYNYTSYIWILIVSFKFLFWSWFIIDITPYPTWNGTWRRTTWLWAKVCKCSCKKCFKNIFAGGHLICLDYFCLWSLIILARVKSMGGCPFVIVKRWKEKVYFTPLIHFVCLTSEQTKL